MTGCSYGDWHARVEALDRLAASANGRVELSRSIEGGSLGLLVMTGSPAEFHSIAACLPWFAHARVGTERLHGLAAIRLDVDTTDIEALTIYRKGAADEVGLPFPVFGTACRWRSSGELAEALYYDVRGTDAATVHRQLARSDGEEIGELVWLAFASCGWLQYWVRRPGRPSSFVIAQPDLASLLRFARPWFLEEKVRRLARRLGPLGYAGMRFGERPSLRLYARAQRLADPAVTVDRLLAC